VDRIVGFQILKIGEAEKMEDIPVLAPNKEVCSDCIFYAYRHGTCDFGYLSRYLSKKRIPLNCSRFRPLKSSPTLRDKILELFKERKKLTLNEICQKFENVERSTIQNILDRLKSRGKIYRIKNSQKWKIRGDPDAALLGPAQIAKNSA